MTGKASSNTGDWTSLWADAQQQYWQSWHALSQRMAGDPAEKASSSPETPWARTFDVWAKLMPSALPPESRDWAAKLAELNKGYLHLGESLWKTLSATQAAPPTPDTWWETVNRGFKEMQDKAAGQFGTAQDPWSGFATFWGMPVDAWRQMCAACSVMPGTMEKAWRGFGMPGVPEIPEHVLNRLFSAPSVGYTREWQEEIQRWEQLWTEHNQARRTYAAKILPKITARATELLTAKLQALAAQGKTPDTLRAFYNLWVDCGEDAYAEAAGTPEFTQAQARLINTLMAVKRQEQKMMDDLLGALNLPTRRELDTSHQRIHRLQRQVWRLQEALDESGILALREEVAGLRREVEALRAEAAAPEKRTPTDN